MWGDDLAVMCGVCMTSTEILCAVLHKFERAYMLRHVFVQWPAIWLFYMFLNWIIFDHRPGSWSVFTMTLSWALAMCVTYPFEPVPREPLVTHVRGSFTTAIVAHGALVFVYAPIISTRLLADASPKLTLFVTGLAFPFITWVGRKVLATYFGRVAKKKSKGDDEKYMRFYMQVSVVKIELALVMGLFALPCLCVCVGDVLT